MCVWLRLCACVAMRACVRRRTVDRGSLGVVSSSAAEVSSCLVSLVSSAAAHLIWPFAALAAASAPTTRPGPAWLPSDMLLRSAGTGRRHCAAQPYTRLHPHYSPPSGHPSTLGPARPPVSACLCSAASGCCCCCRSPLLARQLLAVVVGRWAWRALSLPRLVPSIIDCLPPPRWTIDVHAFPFHYLPFHLPPLVNLDLEGANQQPGQVSVLAFVLLLLRAAPAAGPLLPLPHASLGPPCGGNHQSQHTVAASVVSSSPLLLSLPHISFRQCHAEPVLSAPDTPRQAKPHFIARFTSIPHLHTLLLPSLISSYHFYYHSSKRSSTPHPEPT